MADFVLHRFGLRVAHYVRESLNRDLLLLYYSFSSMGAMLVHPASTKLSAVANLPTWV